VVNCLTLSFTKQRKRRKEKKREKRKRALDKTIFKKQAKFSPFEITI